MIRQLRKLRDLYWEIRYAFQRAFNGYDNVDVFNLDSNMEHRMVKLLTEFRKHHQGLFTCPVDYMELAREDGAMNEEDTDTVIDMIIYHIQMSDADYVLDKLFPERDLCNLDCWYKAHAIANQNRDCAWKLLRLFWGSLWY